MIPQYVKFSLWTVIVDFITCSNFLIDVLQFYNVFTLYIQFDFTMLLHCTCLLFDFAMLLHWKVHVIWFYNVITFFTETPGHGSGWAETPKTDRGGDLIQDTPTPGASKRRSRWDETPGAQTPSMTPSAMTPSMTPGKPMSESLCFRIEGLFVWLSIFFVFICELYWFSSKLF